MLDPNSASAMIFAAGFGTRMGDLTVDRPKPLLQMHGRALIDYTLDHVRAFGPRSVVVNAHYHADQIQAHFRDTDVHVALEPDEILDTGGGLKAALPILDTDIVITLNSDTLWRGPNPIAALAQHWDPDRMDALLLCVPPEMAMGRTGGGDFSIDCDGKISRGGPYTYASVQIIKTAPLANWAENVFSLNVIWDMLIAQGRAHGLVYNAPWYDIGNKDSFNAAAADLGPL